MDSKCNEYTLSRIEAVLAKVDGNAAKAQRLLLSLAEKDDELLRGLAEPHLKSIVGYALQQVIFEDAVEDETVETSEVKVTETKTTIKETPNGGQLEIGEFGMALLQNITDKAGRGQSFGFAVDTLEETPKTSKKHIDSILQLAKKKD